MLPAEKGQRTLRVLPPASPLRRDVQAFLVDRQARGLSHRRVTYCAEKNPLSEEGHHTLMDGIRMAKFYASLEVDSHHPEVVADWPRPRTAHSVR